MAPPIILVTDLTQNPVITTNYHNGNNILDFQAIYKSIKSLKTHPPCSHSTTLEQWPCQPCSKTFLDKYWAGIASFLDYVADFHSHDSGLMSSLWFYLFDIWQESRTWLPCETYMSAAPSTPEIESVSAIARKFMSDYDAALDLVDTVLHRKDEKARPREQVVHPPNGEKKWFGRRWNTGPFVSGLKPWEQFLSAGSPGVAGFAGLEETLKGKGKEKGQVRYIPQAAIAIMQTHTQRARKMAAKLSEETGDTEFLARFDKHSLVFPTKTEQQHEYRSLHGLKTTYSLVNGAPPVERYRGYVDPDMACSKTNFTMLDECVALCRGARAYEPVSGNSGEGEEEGDGNGDGLEPFDMWIVHQRKHDTV
ncbi:hypothetical protein DE146DRAFT_744107 [Phaeosphaeria sp. MPI-PUGE-AT-0046c]|nr:hypothetical protein DE146DRAFT_744107 [Phaeosphaeria sp. MPI-PUGE-AT-0046c]